MSERKPEKEVETRLVRATVEYDGSAYHGWQIQLNGPSVQEAMEKAVFRLCGREARVRGAGRTDAGVHARGQTAVFPVPASIPDDRVAAAMNSRLPGDIAVTDARGVDETFDPRRHCVMKQYSYSIVHDGVRTALDAGRAWRVKWPLDIGAMTAAAGRFERTADFTSFANRERAGEDNVRTVNRCHIVPLPRDAAGRGRLVVFVEGRSFLYNMVRAIAGTLVETGMGRFGPDDIPRIIEARDRAAAGQSAPPWGLCLEWILYPGERRPADGNGLF